MLLSVVADKGLLTFSSEASCLRGDCDQSILEKQVFAHA